jgi:hypothetical protein
MDRVLDMPAGSRWGAALLVAALSACTAVPQHSGPGPDDDGGTDSETYSDSDTESTTTEDLLPEWRLTWAEQFGGGGEDVSYKIARAGPDTFVTTGWFSAEVSFGGTVMNGWGGHMFLMKMNLGGKVEWATWAGYGYTVGRRTAVSGSGEIGVTGYFGNDALFGDGEPNETWLHEDANGDAGFLALYTEDGDLAWVRGFAPVDEACSGATTDGLAFFPDGTVLVTGWFAGEMTLDQDVTLSSPGEKSAFLARFDPGGNLVWGRRVGGPGLTLGGDVLVLPDGSFLLMGTFQGIVVLGEGEDAETALETKGAASAFLARFDGEGDLCWASDLGIDGSMILISHLGSLALLDNGDVTLAGQFSEGSMPAGDGQDLSPVEAPGQGLFLARYTTGGSHVWTRVVPVNDSWWGILWDVAELGDGSLVAVGQFSGTAVFDPGEPEEHSLQVFHQGSLDGFLAAWSAEGDFLWALRQGSEMGFDRLAGIASFSDVSDGHDIIIAGGSFERDGVFGTGGGDEVTLQATGDVSRSDIVLLRFDREEP